MTWHEAKPIAMELLELLTPHCDKIQVCGSLRRRQQEVSDIDIVLIPKRVPLRDMFQNIMTEIPTNEFCKLVNSWQKLKGDPTGKYCQRMFKGVKVELSLATELNYGNLCVIRTGDVDFSHNLMKAILKRGLEQRGGYLYRDEKIIPVREEKDYFDILNLPWVDPPMRNKDAYRKAKLS